MDVTDVFFSGSGGNALSLRPEFKLSSVRQFIDKIADIQFLLRLQYAGPVFRHDENQRVLPQFYQLGLELLGSDHPRSDSEILFVAVGGLTGQPEAMDIR